MDLGITDLASFVVGTVVIVLLPGPNSLFVMSVASRSGATAGWRGALGVFCGDALLMLAAATGAASLLAAQPALFAGLRLAGAAYLGWLGLKLIRAAWAGWHAPPAEAPAADPALRVTRPFRTAFAISLLNPKAILFFFSFFIQFVEPDAPNPALAFAVLGAVVQCCSLSYLALLIGVGSRLAARLARHRRLAAGATGGVGALFLGFGARLAGASL